MTPAEIATRLEETFGTDIVGKKLDGSWDPYVEVKAEAIAKVAAFCKDDPALSLDYLKDLQAVDWLITDEKRAQKLAVKPHLDINYQLFSFKHKHDITLKVTLPRWKDDKPGQLPEVPTVSKVWLIADWHEREAYDLTGVNFLGHPNLCRILCAEDWIGHPLRKDYEFPLEYHGVRGK